jgi:type IV secretory pathway VirB4 component
VFFFDEAHLLFNDAPQVLLDKIEQVIRLIRSKGVGVWFVSQNPSDIPITCSGSSVTACSTPCAPLRRKIRKQSRRANHARQSGL